MKLAVDITRPHKSLRISIRGEKGNLKCVDCKKKIKTGERFFNIGLNATTMNEKFYSKFGCVWYSYCEACA
jgi:hypothetical protein